MIFPWLKTIENLEDNLDKKIALQQQQIDLLRQENETIRKECEGIRHMFVNLLGQTTKLIAQTQNQSQNNNGSSPFYLDNTSEETQQELENLKQENAYLREKIEAQEEIILRLNEELEEDENPSN
ncbi:hypothetical protein [Candidatus Uabimicrobium amorphum]|uniref:Uncharacterized protein n=1 Tax=Uabimicrobium amorphum TaxID=2596890 RepID=A0A5S9ITJ9_UABAM|nr:hypothetical protein [Candidatus Uabimicrobium amorphum]BBM87674.1 hypothetical protein UABAM_06086 [Candidatus Uabimicrobium amorphum]